MKSNRFICLILVLLLLLFCGCEKEKTPTSLEEGQYYAYYVNTSGTALVSYVYEPTAKDTEGLIAELLERCQMVPDGTEGRRPIPANVVLSEEAVLEKNILNIHFDTTYTTMDKVTELLCKATLAKTLTQIEGVDYISIYVNGKPYNGTTAGSGTSNTNAGTGETGSETVSVTPILYSASDFVDNTGDATNQYTQADLVLYFANENGTALVKEERSVIYSSSLSLEKVVLNQLIEGPKTEGHTATLPSTLKVQGVSLRDSICYVDLDNTFLEVPMNVTDTVELYSLVNSLTQLDTINQVQITINGSSQEVFRNNISLSGKFSFDETYIEKTESQSTQ